MKIRNAACNTDRTLRLWFSWWYGGIIIPDRGGKCVWILFPSGHGNVGVMGVEFIELMRSQTHTGIDIRYTNTVTVVFTRVDDNVYVCSCIREHTIVWISL